MAQGFIIFIVIGAVLSYFLVGFVGDIQEDDTLSKQDKIIAKEDISYHQKDSIGQTILVFKDISFERKLSVWKKSPIRQEFMDFFPNFDQMRLFVNDRIIDTDFQQKLINKINQTEDDYFSGKATQEQAKEALDNFGAK